MKRGISRSFKMYYSFNMTELTVTECNSNISKSNQLEFGFVCLSSESILLHKKECVGSALC